MHVGRSFRNLSNRVLILTLAVVALHATLLAISIPHYRVTIDSGYHVSLGRYYGEHYVAFWDHINFGPTGRPNLQGPALHFAIGRLGRLLGGSGWDYVLANAILAFLQWLAAVATVAFFATRLGGRLTALYAVSLFCGCAFIALSYQVGIPSGWSFIMLPWLIYFALSGHLMLATLAATGAIYVHVAGYATVPIALIGIALITRRLRPALIIGLSTLVLTAPYTVHLLLNLGWFSGKHSRAAILIDPLPYLLAAGWAIDSWRHRARGDFLLAWFCAPIAWLAQDPSRFLMQSGMVVCVMAGLFVARKMPPRRGFVLGFVALATLLPLGVPALLPELAWDLGLRRPDVPNWRRAAALAQVIKANHLQNRLVSDYMPSLCPPIAVFAPVSCDEGHWVEVQPPSNPADRLSLSRMVLVLPLPPGDPLLGQLSEDGWVRYYGAAGDSSVITMDGRSPPANAAALVAKIVARDAAWLGRNATNNSLRWSSLGRVATLLSAAKWKLREQRLLPQRERSGEIELALLAYSYALEPVNRRSALAVRHVAQRMGEMASLFSDDLTIDFVTDADVASLRSGLATLAQRVQVLRRVPIPPPALLGDFSGLLDRFFRARGETYALAGFPRGGIAVKPQQLPA